MRLSRPDTPTMPAATRSFLSPLRSSSTLNFNSLFRGLLGVVSYLDPVISSLQLEKTDFYLALTLSAINTEVLFRALMLIAIGFGCARWQPRSMCSAGVVGVWVLR